MNVRGWAIVATTLLLGACATPQQPAVPLFAHSINASPDRVGVAMTTLPKADTSFPGAACLLCLATASIANASLTSHAQKLPHEDLIQLKHQIADLIRSRKTEAMVIEAPIELSGLNDATPNGANVPGKDFAPLAAKYKIDKLVVIEIKQLGFVRSYSGYIATAEPKVVLNGVGYLVNLKTNRYEWYAPVHVMRSASGKWDEPPNFPGLTNAYFQALELGKDSFLRPWLDEPRSQDDR